MGHTTVGFLESQLAASYVHGDGEFRGVLNQILPRIYSSGDWVGLLVDAALTTGPSRTVALPSDSVGVLFATIENEPRSVRGRWHDYRMLGRTDGAGALYGLLDDGIHPTSVPLNPDYFFHLEFRPKRVDVVFTGDEVFAVTGVAWDGEVVSETVSPTAGSAVVRLANAALTHINSISYSDIRISVEITAQVMEVGEITGNANAGTILPVTDSTRGFVETLASATTSPFYDIHNVTPDTGWSSGLNFTVTGVTDAGVTFTSSNSSYAISGGAPNGGHYVAIPTTDLDTNSYVVGQIIGKPSDAVGSLNYRVFRVAEASNTSGEVVNLLLKRKHQWITENSDVVYVDNLSAIKHAMLGLVAEDNADTDRATYHWGRCEEILDKELGDYLKAAIPVPDIKPFGDVAHAIPALL
jgi:hypothetical protein